MSAVPQPGRRELNKTRTREAVTEALLSLLVENPPDDVTVEQVAERAGISRRTFFNYYAGLAAVIGEVLRSYTDRLAEALPADALRRQPVAALRRLLRTAGLDLGFLTWLAALNCHGPAKEQAVLLERAVWTDLGGWFRDEISARLSAQVDPLYVATLADAVMSAFSAATEPWLAQLDGRVEVTEADADAFLEHVDRALGYLETGWTSTA
ncbi:TetR/AcrR family transcriptional regulator [Ornithinimicrobium avium]|uniref:TetR family transcriptional regulator n=1 Tax=Ornithinimicrobium avium TaxID=2283195 RepID=A0A345NR29_9MICO|nr:TetR/AcrR family transcriptional regulator [Ornithinimicrobium avium]AXH97487.1 TetR family transcriptional regulator [Ornithinimicrobium avium]